MSDDVYIHPTADVSPRATLGPGTRIWHQAQVREGAVLGRNCILGKGAYVDFGVRIGDNVKVQNRASIYHGVTLEDGVFVGPHVIFTNDKLPRAINPDGTLKSYADWEVGQVLVKAGASLGAGAIIVAGVTIGRFALVGAGAVVTRDVPDYGLVYGNPARLVGYVCENGHRAEETVEQRPGGTLWRCPTCGREVIIAK
jgi:acetyltransferase-like isoleucine patch superfamily enzyme